MGSWIAKRVPKSALLESAVRGKYLWASILFVVQRRNRWLIKPSLFLNDRRWRMTHLTVIVRRHAGSHAGVVKGWVGRPGSSAICRGGRQVNKGNEVLKKGV